MRQRLSASGRSRIVEIPKGNGSNRRLYIPDPDYREALVRSKPALESVFHRYGGHCADHAFTVGRNSVTNAYCHAGAPFVLSLDIEDFFSFITPRLVQAHLTKSFIELLFEDGAARQGLLTSPLVANLAMASIDKRLSDFCRALGDVSYSRYADDLTFSFKDRDLSSVIEGSVIAVLRESGLRLNPNKSRLQNSKNGCVHITGVALVDNCVRPTRRTLRRIRAASHQCNQPQLRGLEEWALCKFPR